MHGVRADAPWCPWNIEFIRRINGLDDVDDVHRIVHDASYLVLGLGDVYLGAPVATPLDPRHRLVTTKYNPARTWTPENAVGIGGAYLCIYGMEGPGGYQFVGRTVQVWNRDRRGPHFDQPWLLRPFDQLRFHPVDGRRAARPARRAGRRTAGDRHRARDVPARRPPRASSPTTTPRSRRSAPASSAAFAAERAAWADRAGSRDATRRGRSRRRGARPRSPTTGGRGIWITARRPPTSRCARRGRRRRRRQRGAPTLPLAGPTLAVKDNIDVAGLPTTAGCPAFAYQPATDAPAVAALTAAGAVVIGKTNLDQFATGLVGVRSPYGICPNAHWPGSGQPADRAAARPSPSPPAWSTSPSAPTPPDPVACRRPATASSASSRPAAGSAPTASCRRAGRSTACRCSPATSTAAALGVRARRARPDDPWSRRRRRAVPGGRLRVGVPTGSSRSTTTPTGRRGSAPSTVATWRAGRDVVDVDLAPFLAAGALLYGGSFVAERYEAVGRLRRRPPDDVDPVVGPIIAAAGRAPGVAGVPRPHRAGPARRARPRRRGTPSTCSSCRACPACPTVAEVLAEPIAVNTMLGTYTNFVNLLDLCAVTCRSDRRSATAPPASVTLIAPAWARRRARQPGVARSVRPPASVTP